MKMFVSRFVWPTAIVMLVLHVIVRAFDWSESFLLWCHEVAVLPGIVVGFVCGLWKQDWQTGTARGIIGGVLVYLGIAASALAIIYPVPAFLVGFGIAAFFSFVEWCASQKENPRQEAVDHGPCTVYTADGTLVDLTAENAQSPPLHEGM
jgi:chromate transport protein ChrA